MDRSGAPSIDFDLALEPPEAFAALLQDLATALRRGGVHLEPAAGGRITQGSDEVGKVTSWEPGRRIVIEWRATPWEPGSASEIVFGFEPVEGGTRVTVEHRGLGEALGGPDDVAGWLASEAIGPFIRGATPRALGDWITDRRARRPWGVESRGVYRDPLYHYPGFRALLEELALGPDDYLLEVACGGGALLEEALRSGCRAAAIDHSPDMVEVAREVNRGAITEGRLDVLEASAERLPFPDGVFTCAAMTGVLGFLTDPVSVLAEIRRVLRSGGRIVVAGSDPELRGTPGAPEPMASRLRFYDDDALAALGHQAGFATVRVVRRNLEAFASEAGIPDEHVPLFAGVSRFLVAGGRE